MEIYWIWLSRIKFIGPVLQKQLIAHFHTAKAVYEAKGAELSEVPSMNKKALQSILSSRNLKEAENILRKAKKNEIGILLFDSESYPDFSKRCKESPIVLYYRGKLKPVRATVGVIGARRCTSYGRKVAEQIGEELAVLSIPVISGFAKGIDSYAQAACVRKGGYTIAFLGCGPDICYPPEQRSLYHEIIENDGIFISKYPPGTPPISKYFIERNALISAWSSELVVVEAGEQSGALWTAQFSSKNNRPIYAVPNHIGIPEGVGTNFLLSQGVPPYLGIHSLETFKGKKNNHNQSFAETPLSSHPILQILSENPSTIQQLSNQLALNETEIIDQLFDLELEKKIVIRGNVVSKI